MASAAHDQTSQPVLQSLPDPLTSVQSAGQPPQAGTGLLYAGFGERAAAAIADGLIAYVCSLPFVIPATMIMESSLGVAVLLQLCGAVVVWLYYALQESGQKRATLGKRWLGLQVWQLNGYTQIGFGRATGRYFAKILSALLLMAGYLMQPFTQRKQALHDKIAGVVVIKADSSKRNSAAIFIVVGVILALIVMAAIAVPAYKQYTDRAKVAAALTVAKEARDAVTAFYLANNRVPSALEEAGYTPPRTNEGQLLSSVNNHGVVTTAIVIDDQPRAILMIPVERSTGIEWMCRLLNVDDSMVKGLPDCKAYDENEQVLAEAPKPKQVEASSPPPINVAPENFDVRTMQVGQIGGVFEALVRHQVHINPDDLAHRLMAIGVISKHMDVGEDSIAEYDLHAPVSMFGMPLTRIGIATKEARGPGTSPPYPFQFSIDLTKTKRNEVKKILLQHGIDSDKKSSDERHDMDIWLQDEPPVGNNPSPVLIWTGFNDDSIPEVGVSPNSN
jgi:uncharacterized RDD family membrane protein YckC/Tfp pilus assembly protein PilE